MFSTRKPPMFFWFGAFMILTLATNSLLPKIAGFVNPASSQISVAELRAGPQSERNMLVRFAFEKYRNCSLITTEWWIGSPENGIRVPAQSTGADPVRNLRRGDRFVSPFWRVEMPAETFMSNAEVYFVYRCHPFFEHRVRVWHQGD